jgi:hypothetical protein
MNERIRELAKQAGLTQAKDFKSGDEVKNFVFGNGLEKFAELIVRECAEVAYKRSVHSRPSDIFKHFGIEE